MAEAPNTLSTLNGLYKEVYGDEISVVIPSFAKIQEKVKFKGGEKQLGNKFHVPVMLGDENGFTYAGPSAGAFTLNDSAASTLKDATVEGYQIMLKSQMSVEAAARAVSTKNAFKSATSVMMASMQRSHRKRLELSAILGGFGLGTLSAASTTSLTISAATWAEGIWSGLEGVSIDLYTSAGALRGTSSIVSVNPTTRVVTTLGAIASAAATDVIYFAGAYGNEADGIIKILNASSGNIFGISTATYSLWKGTQSAVGGALTRQLVGKAISSAVARGLDSEITLFLNPNVFNDLTNNEAALVQFINAKGKFENGGSTLKYYAQNGVVSVEPHPFMPVGYAAGMDLECWSRVGAVDYTVKDPGAEGGIVFERIAGKAGFEARSYSNQSIFCDALSRNILLTGITTT